MNSKAKWLSATLMAALLTPVAVQAQTREIERERRDMREERRELRDAQRYGSPRDVREERREYVDARHDYRDAKRDWRDDRRHAGWNAPFRYQRFSVGSTLNRSYYAPAYRPTWDARWGVPHAGRALTYVRHYDDLLLVNMRSGKVVKVYRGHFHWR